MNELILPWPPALNNLFLNIPRIGRVKSPRYRAWLASAACALREQSPPKPFGSRCDVRIFLTPPTKVEADADNYLKAPMDFLVAAGVLEGDSRRYVRSVFSCWTDAPPKKPGGLRIELESA